MLTRTNRPDLTLILPQLLIGAYPRPRDAAWLRTAHHVTAVLSLQDDSDLVSKGLRLHELERAYARQALAFQRVPVPDGDTHTFAARLDEIVAHLTRFVRHDHRVYVHCNAGMNRAPTVAIAYLHAAHGWTLPVARDFVKERRHCVPYMQLLQARYANLKAMAGD